MRALAAIGVLTTHVAFQTRAVELPVLGPVLGRLDLAVALFFGLSGFLLWRPWVAAAHGAAPTPSVRRYLTHRFVRIWPAYLVVVVLVLTLLPDAKNADLTVWAANLTLTQVFVPLSLTAGLTQMWSLSVEVAFYALLPVIGWALLRLRVDRRIDHRVDHRVGGPTSADESGRAAWRIPALVALGVVSLGWAWVAMVLPVAAGVEPKNWVFGHLPWFVAGLVLAELVGAIELDDHRPVARWVRVVARVGAHRVWMGIALVSAYALACTPLAGPTGLGALAPWQFAVKMVLGAICGFALLAPLVLSARPFRVLTSRVMLALGRWSYGIFIWHLAVLAVVFPLFGILPFNGDFLVVWAITLGLTTGVSAASYAFIEEPARRWLRTRERSMWERRRDERSRDERSRDERSRDERSRDERSGSTVANQTVSETATSAGS
ncbi:acyltransferase [Gordonia sp. ABSL11-1]|uniref:acyltransferase family protein n=1 Tax=Gordonia sp. ABSL11-1 TaxID=3053924 RepID=UPI002572CFD2|nr:acyltransferase [Gordonia sp. ABSL11-1]MDL9946613.1 acyltransferase [Gordonia sp. ABSL11-1]